MKIPNRHRRQFLSRLAVGAASVSAAPLLTACKPEDENKSATPASTGDSKSLGNRVTGMVVTEPASGDFGIDVIQRIKNSGASSTSLSVYWDGIERNPSVYAPDPNYLAIAELFYPPYDLAITLAFSVIDTTNRRLPADMAGRSLDDPLLISRFNAMLDWAVTQVPSVNIRVISIGNEVDVYLNAHPEEWPAWQTFFTQTSAHAHTLWSNAVIGCKATYNGLMQEPSRTAMNTLNQSADGCFVTYYAIAADFSVTAPASVSAIFSDLVSFSEGQGMYLLEHGCPSSPFLGSGEVVQADFITETFKAWDTFAANIPQIEFFALHDFNPLIVSELEDYYGLKSERFAAYLESLGLRTHADSGADKLAWQRFINEMSLRA